MQRSLRCRLPLTLFLGWWLGEERAARFAFAETYRRIARTWCAVATLSFATTVPFAALAAPVHLAEHEVILYYGNGTPFTGLVVQVGQPQGTPCGFQSHFRLGDLVMQWMPWADAIIRTDGDQVFVDRFSTPGFPPVGCNGWGSFNGGKFGAYVFPNEWWTNHGTLPVAANFEVMFEHLSGTPAPPPSASPPFATWISMAGAAYWTVIPPQDEFVFTDGTYRLRIRDASTQAILAQSTIHLIINNDEYLEAGGSPSYVPPKNYGRPKAGACVGNPCNPSNGNKYQVEEDFIGGDGVPPFVRSYNSQLVDQNGGLGFGWKSSAHKSLAIASTTVEVRSSSGRAERFVCPSTTCTGDGDTTLRLSKSASAYTLTHPEGVVERYSLTGSLLTETDAAGRITTYTYSNGRLASIVGPYGHTLSFGYTGTRLTSMTAPGGALYSYTYDASNNLARVDYPDDTAKVYHYEHATFPHHLTGISYVDADETVTRYSTYDYDANGRAMLTEHAGGMEQFTLAYDTGAQTTVTDAAGTQEVMTFQTNQGVKNLVSSVNQVADKSVTQSFDANNNLVCRKDEEGRVTSYTYNGTNQLTSMTEGQSGSCPNPLSTEVTRTTTYNYLSPNLHLPTAISSPSVHAGHNKNVTLLYQDPLHPTLATSITESGYTPDGVSIGRTTTLAYEVGGRLQTLDASRTDVSDVTGFTYYDCTAGGACGQLQTITNAVGHVWTLNTYNASGKVTQMTQPNGVIVTYGYDARQRLRTVTEAASGFPPRTTTYDYYANGLVEQVTDPAGAFVHYTYNDALFLTEIRDNSGNRIEYGYDAVGNRTGETIRDSFGTITSSRAMEYDEFNQLDTVSLPRPAGGFDVWDYDFDATGLLQSVTSPEGRSTTYDNYDALGRLRSFLNALGQRTTYAHDTHDNVTSVTALTTASYPAGVVTSYAYDDFGRRVRETSADRGVLTHTYDEADNLTLTVDARGLSTDYVYDDLNRLTTIQAEPQGGGVPETMSIGYDDVTPDGRLGQIVAASAQNGGLVYDYGYDAFGRRTAEQLAYTGLNTTALTQYTYDAADRIEEIRRGTLAQPNLWVTRNARDATGLITDIEDRRATPVDVVGAVQHAPFGPYLAMTFGNARQVTRALDQRYRVSSTDLAGVDSQSYTWTPDDNLERVVNGGVDAFWNPGFFYTHDALDRTLTSSRLDFWNVGHANYDLNGDLGKISQIIVTEQYLEEPVILRNYTYAPQTNRLVQIQHSYNGQGQLHPVTSDSSGNLTGSSMLTKGYEYDSLNQLRRVYPAGSSGTTVALYDFNPFGERARKQTSSGGVTQVALYSYLPDGKLLGETIFNNNVLAEQRDYVWMDETPVAMHVTKLNASGVPTADQTYYLHADHLNTPRRATNAAGAAVWLLGGDGEFFYGEGYYWNSSALISPINLRFPGQYFDEEARLHYNYYRHYWPQAGRYMQHDPIGLDGGLNPYLYANGNPVRYTDPSGLIAPVVVAAGVGYARCIASCTAIGAAVAFLADDDCFSLGGTAGSCALDCLNPFNWVKIDKLGAIARKAKQFRGELPEARGLPHTRFRTDEHGVTHYETYNYPSPGLGRRVDVVGPDHGGVPTPHTVDTVRHANPSDPTRFGYRESRPRPSTPAEIPRRR